MSPAWGRRCWVPQLAARERGQVLAPVLGLEQLLLWVALPHQRRG